MTDRIDIQFDASQLIDGIDSSVSALEKYDAILVQSINTLVAFDTKATEVFNNLQKTFKKEIDLKIKSIDLDKVIQQIKDFNSKYKLKVDASELVTAKRIVDDYTKSLKELNAQNTKVSAATVVKKKESTSTEWADSITTKFDLSKADASLQVRFKTAIGAVQELINKEKIAVSEANRIFEDLNKNITGTYINVPRQVQRTLEQARAAYSKYLQDLKKDAEGTKISTGINVAGYEQVQALLDKKGVSERATPGERLQFARASASLQDFVKRSQLSADQINLVWRDVSLGQIRKYSGELGRLEVLTAGLINAHRNLGSASNFEMARMATKAEEYQRKLTEINFSWQTMFRLLVTQAASRAFGQLVQGFSNANDEALKLNRTIANIQTIDISHFSSASIQKSLVKISNEFGIAPLQEAEGAYQALSNQIGSVTQSLEFMNTANRYALVGNTDIATSVDSISAAIHAYDYSVKDAEEIAAKFAKTIDLGKVTGSELGKNIGRLLVPAHQLGVAFDEINAAIATTTIAGINQDVASTLLRNLLLGLIKPTKELKDEINSWGYASAQQAVQAEGFGRVLQRLTDRIKGNQEAMAAMFPDMREFQAMSIFAGNGLNVFNDSLEKIKKSTGEFDDKVKLVATSSSVAWEKFKQKIDNLFLGEIATPWLNRLASLTNNFDSLTPSANAFNNTLSILESTVFSLATIGIVRFASSLKTLGLAIVGTLSPTVAFISLLGSAAIFALNGYRTEQERVTESLNLYTESLQKNREEQDKRNKITNQDITETLNKNIGERIRIQAESLKGYSSLIDFVTSIQKGAVKEAKNNIEELQSKYQEVHSKVAAIRNQIESEQSKAKSLQNDIAKEHLPVPVTGKGEYLFVEIQRLKQELDAAAKSADQVKFDTTLASLKELEAEQDRLTSKDYFNPRKFLRSQEIIKRNIELARESGVYTKEQADNLVKGIDSTSSKIADIFDNSRNAADIYWNYHRIKKEDLQKQLATAAPDQQEELKKQIAVETFQQKILEVTPVFKTKEQAVQDVIKLLESTTEKTDILSAEKQLIGAKTTELDIQTAIQDTLKANTSELQKQAKIIENFDWSKTRSPKAFERELDRQIDAYSSIKGTKSKEAADSLKQERERLENRNTVSARQEELMGFKQDFEARRNSINNQIQSSGERLETLKKDIATLNLNAQLNTDAFKTVSPGVNDYTVSNLLVNLNNFLNNPRRQDLPSLQSAISNLPIAKDVPSSNANALSLKQSIENLRDAISSGSILKTEQDYTNSLKALQDLKDEVGRNNILPPINNDIEYRQQPISSPTSKSKDSPLSSLNIEKIEVHTQGDSFTQYDARNMAEQIYQEIKYLQQTGMVS